MLINKRNLVFLLAGILALMFIVTGCTHESPQITYFPVQNTPQDSCPDGAIEGKLVLENGMLWISESVRPRTLVIWPYGFTWRAEGDTIHILDNTGEMVIRLGDVVKMGGMDINLENQRSWVNGMITPPIREDYSGFLFVVCGAITNDTLDLEKARERLGIPDD